MTPEGDREILVASELVEEAYDFGTTHNRDLRMLREVKRKS